MKSQVSHRVDDALLERAGVYALERKVTRSSLIEEALRVFLDDASRGVPDLPAAETTQDQSTPVGDGLSVKPLGHITPAERDDDSSPRARHARLAREMGWSA